MSSKQYQQLKEKAPTETVDIAVAIAWLKDHARKSFEETIELHLKLGVDSSKSDQMVRGSVVLPSGAVTEKRIAVFTNDATQAAAAKEAGAALVGGDDLVAQVKADGKLDADIAVASPDMMAKVGSVARILGPQGLMPNPKTGTVSPEPAAVVKELLGGKLSFKMDQSGNIHESVGKASWEVPAIVANVEAVLAAVREAKPAAAKGVFLRGCTLASTMSPGIRVIA